MAYFPGASRKRHQRDLSGKEIPPVLSVGRTVGHQEQPYVIHMTKLYVPVPSGEISFSSSVIVNALYLVIMGLKSILLGNAGY